MAATLSLYDHETALVDALAALETAESDDERTALALRVQDYLLKAEDKRDRFARFLQHLETLEGYATAEIARLKERKDRIAKQRAQLEEFAARTIASLGMDAEGKYQRLEGRTHSLRVQENPPSVVITNPERLPLIYLYPPKPAPPPEPNKKEIASAIKAGIHVPGADLKPGNLRLVVK